MKYKVYSVKQFRDLLKDNGYKLERTRGSHEMWRNPHKDKQLISLPVVEFNPMIAQRLIKEHKLQNQIQAAISKKWRLFDDLGIRLTTENIKKIQGATSIAHLDRICRDIILSQK